VPTWKIPYNLRLSFGYFRREFSLARECLLNWLLKHATNHAQTRCATLNTG